MSFLTDEKREILDKFVLFVKEQLELKTVPTIKIQNHRDGLKTTANYDYTKENKIIKVCAKNRALVDVCRSIAHEMVHHKQFGGEIEDEANAKAGQFIKMYSKEDPNIYNED
jgi:hypothetical protein